MFRIIDRYIIKAVLPPMGLSLLLLTFILVIQTVQREAEALIVKGIAWTTFVHVLILLLPSALSLTIPMSVLLGILIGFGRLSADREFVAMQSCGVSPYRLIRPIAAVALLAAAATAHQMIVALPDANQTFREITFNVIANRAESNVKPRVFYREFPNRIIYARDVVPGGWRDVFLADTSKPELTTVYFAKEGRLRLDREKRLVQLELTGGTWHTTSVTRPAEYEGGDYNSTIIHLDPATVFPTITPPKTEREMSIAELKESIAAGRALNDQGHRQRYMIQLKFAIPVASLVLALIALTLGVSHRKDGRLASFALGFGVIFGYYVVLWTGRAAAISGQLPAGLAAWVPNIIFGVAGVALLLRRAGSPDQLIRISIPVFWRLRGLTVDSSVTPAGHRPASKAIVLVIRIPRINLDWLPRPALLDLYVARQYLRVFVIGLFGLLGIFYISTFMDLAEKLFRGSATSALLLQYFFFQTPQFVYYIVPLAVLVATLVTIGLMTKNSELVVMRACGISLYRTAAPVLLFGVAASGLLFGLQERVMAHSNKEADRLIRVIRGLPPASSYRLDRRWTVAQNGDIYHYDVFDAGKNAFHQFAVYHLDLERWNLRSVTSASRVVLTPREGPGEPEGSSAEWVASTGWTREFSEASGQDVAKTVVKYERYARQVLPLESPAYFKSDEPDAELMTYGELRQYIAQLQIGGFGVVPYLVALQRKVAFPFVTVVMTLLAVPFAVSTGSRGALYGIGVGIVLAIVYWLMISICGAIGAGGLMPPVLAAWTPNILFAAAAAYLILTVRT